MSMTRWVSFGDTTQMSVPPSGNTPALGTASPAVKLSVEAVGAVSLQLYTVSQPDPVGRATVKLALIAVMSAGSPAVPAILIRFGTPASSLVMRWFCRLSAKRNGVTAVKCEAGPAGEASGMGMMPVAAIGSTVNDQVTVRAWVVTVTV